jgi:hypothetical protein
MAQFDFSPPPHVSTAPQETVWAEPGSTRHLMRLEVVTDSRRLVGVVQHMTAVRPVDLLNGTDEPLALTDLEVTTLEGQADAPHRWPQTHIRKQAIAFIIPHEAAPQAAAIGRRPLEYVEKRPWRVSVLLSRFMVTGCFHLAPAADPANASLFWNAGFVPLTDAEAVFLPDPATTWKSAVIIVNAARVEAYCPPAALAAE